MYLRQFNQSPSKIVQNGKAFFGTFSGVPQRLDIRGMRAPYAGIPLPSVISNLRIKSRIGYLFASQKFIGISQFYDFKAIGLGEIIFWNKETGKKFVYHTIMPPRRRFVPALTARGICACYRNSRYIKISWGRQHQHHALTFKVKGDEARPDCEGYFYSPMQDEMHCDLMFVNPSPTTSRCTATWLTSMKIQGQISINKEQNDDSQGLALMQLTRAYYKMHSNSIQADGIGTIELADKNKANLIFHLSQSNLDSADSDTYNSNALIINGTPTALPPVYMTHPFGIDKKWIIQDTESMVDLTFTPVSVNSRVLNLIALRTSYNTMYGMYDGILLDKDGRKIVLKNFPGLLQKGMLRL